MLCLSVTLSVRFRIYLLYPLQRGKTKPRPPLLPQGVSWVCVVMEWLISTVVDRTTNIKTSPYTDLRLMVPTSARTLHQDSWDLVPLYHNFLVYIFHNITVWHKTTSSGQAPVLVLWGMWSTPSLPNIFWL